MGTVNPLQGTGRRVIGEMMLKKERRAHSMDAILHVLSTDFPEFSSILGVLQILPALINLHCRNWFIFL